MVFGDEDDEDKDEDEDDEDNGEGKNDSVEVDDLRDFFFLSPSQETTNPFLHKYQYQE